MPLAVALRLVLAPGQHTNQVRLVVQLTDERQTHFTPVVSQVCEEFLDVHAPEFRTRL